GRRENVRASEIKNKKHLHGPATDAADDRESLDDLLVGHAEERAPLGDFPGDDPLSKIFERAGFGLRQPCAAKERELSFGDEIRAQLLFIELENPGPDTARRFSAQLLISDGLGEGEEDVRLSAPEAHRSGPLDDRAKLRLEGVE